MNVSTQNIRYIVFLIDSKIKQHDGKIFCSYTEAKQYVQDLVDGCYADKAVIGMFVNDNNAKEIFISHIDSIGFKGDKKNIDQLELFKPVYP